MLAIKKPNDLYIVNPNLIVEYEGERLSLLLPYFGEKISSDIQLKKILDMFIKPLSLSKIRKNKIIDQEIVNFLINYFIIISLESSIFLGYGLLKKVEKPIGFFKKIQDIINQKSQIYNCFFGVPIDSTSNLNYSPKSGPNSVRNSLFPLLNKNSYNSTGRSIKDNENRIIDLNLGTHLNLQNISICDIGDIVHHPHNEGIAIVGQRIEWIIIKLLESGHRPIMLGGDHSISYYAIEGLLKKYSHIGIIHFDAHSDMRVGIYESFEPLTNANVFRKLIQNKRIKTLLQIGIRERYRTVLSSSGEFGQRIKRLSSKEVYNLEPKVVFSSLENNIPYYLTFDIDVIDPSLAKEVASPVAGGLNYYQVQSLLCYAVEHFDIIAADFVEVCGTRQSYNQAAEITSSLIVDLISAKHVRKLNKKLVGKQSLVSENNN